MALELEQATLAALLQEIDWLKTKLLESELSWRYAKLRLGRRLSRAEDVKANISMLEAQKDHGTSDDEVEIAGD
jgi:hypothetical protein